MKVFDRNGREIKKGDTVTGYQFQGGIRTGAVIRIKRNGLLEVGKRERVWVDPKRVAVI